MATVMSSSKRQRTDEPETEQSQEIFRSTSMWLDDGNIILMAQNTQFRVHRTVLAMHSTVFRDMFRIPQPQKEHNVDGCSVVHLSDSPQLVEHFLNALYKRSYPAKALTLDDLEAFLCLGHKYQVTHLRDEALACISTEFPTTLQGWDDLKDDFTTLDALNTTNATLRILRLAHEFHLFRHVPVLLLLSGTATPLVSQLWTFVSLLHILSYLQEELYDCVPHIISTDTILQIALAIEKFREARSEVTFAWLKTIPCGPCTTTAACLEVGKRLALLHFAEAKKMNPVAKWQDDWGKRLCKKCRSFAKASHNAARPVVWENLPKYCKLPGWDELRNSE